MKQNNTLTRFLTIGLIANVLMLVNGCITRDYGKEGEFYFVNKTAYKIVINEQRLKFEIEPSKIFYLYQAQPSSKVVKPEDYQDPITPEIGLSYDITIHIGDKCLKQVKSDVNSILNIKSYKAEKLGERKYKFTYTFTDADYERAVACP